MSSLCEDGDVAISGGYLVDSSETGIRYDGPSGASNGPTGNGWSVIGPSSGIGSVRAIAVCYDNPPLR